MDVLLKQSAIPSHLELPGKDAVSIKQGCLVLVGKDIELDAGGRQFEPYLTGVLACCWRPCGVTWDAVPEQSWC